MFTFCVELMGCVCVRALAPTQLSATQWQMHRGRLLLRVFECEVTSTAQQMYRRLVSSDLWIKTTNSKNCFDLIYGHLSVWVNKINKQRASTHTQSGWFAIAAWWKKWEVRNHGANVQSKQSSQLGRANSTMRSKSHRNKTYTTHPHSHTEKAEVRQTWRT